ncbi:ABC transporter ATP-binding protein [Paracoccus laeviglucosivorans]|uniref:Peptide/nickel transport system ATP-binding protein n=1 Tax=Paracoccus laeviglucosivorans TaxID=1197861 RepID=A0A521D910_9RHOB|nr:dipeptide ABC transporter ATP-binding protein [Paracoccus laeviglucosivorans]SMO68206.1 peptide/nickel transport system ATP-binding protein [Paracoccus laeviglucosivorans]
MIQISELSVGLGDANLLHDVKLDLSPGQITALVGESGSGKSLTALAIIGLLPPAMRADGRIQLDGENLLELPETQMCRIRGKRIAMVFQEPMTALNPLMPIGDQVAEALRLHHNMDRDAARAVARERLDRVGLSGPRFPLTLFPHELSGGQRQRVAIALAIAQQPDLLIADEPTTALDVTTQKQILDLLTGLVRDEGMSLLLITHDLAVVADMADQVAVMQRGQIVETGTPIDILTAPQHPYTRDLLAATMHQPRLVLSPPDAPVLLEVRNVVRDYPLPRPDAGGTHFRAVDDVSLIIREREAVGLVGESGCGKSTLTRAILGLDAIQGGTIRLAGQEIHAGQTMPKPLRAQMQIVFQDPYGSFDPRWRIERVVAEPFHLIGRPKDWRDRVAEALFDVGITGDAMRRHVHEFSGGQRQRIALARAMIIRPSLIVLDEAVSALDVQVRTQVLDLLARLRVKHGLSYLFVSHDLSVVRQITDRVLIMCQGKIVEEGATADVMTDPAHPYTKSLLDATPRLPDTLHPPAHNLVSRLADTGARH